MSEITRQKVRFTGKRTGMDAMFILGLGIVSKGQIIELDSDVAQRWAEPLDTGDGAQASDWTLSGDEITRTPEEALESNFKQQEKLIEHAHPAIEVVEVVKESAPEKLVDAKDKPKDGGPQS